LGRGSCSFQHSHLQAQHMHQADVPMSYYPTVPLPRACAQHSCRVGASAECSA
jgi:hypothetical protein